MEDITNGCKELSLSERNNVASAMQQTSSCPESMQCSNEPRRNLDEDWDEEQREPGRVKSMYIRLSSPQSLEEIRANELWWAMVCKRLPNLPSVEEAIQHQADLVFISSLF